MTTDAPGLGGKKFLRTTCWLLLEESEIVAMTRSIGPEGLTAQIAPASFERGPPAPGTQARVRLLLSPKEFIEAPAELTWVAADDRDASGAQVVTIDLKFSQLSEEQARRLAVMLGAFKHKVMLVDDEPDNLITFRSPLEDDFDVSTFGSGPEALAALEKTEFAAIVTDYRMPGMNGLEFLKRVRQRYPGLRTSRLVLTAFPDLRQIQELINEAGIFHYLQKPVDMDTLQQVVRRAVDAYALAIENEDLKTRLGRSNQRLSRENQYLRRRLAGAQGFENIVGKSAELLAALAQVSRIRGSDAPVFIHGETGTGKELIARALHEGSPRAKGPFIAQNCAGIPETLALSTLFGHKRGAFTGADRDQIGVFEDADGGTLFLDEVAELPLNVQAMVLRVLQGGEIVPVGSTRPVKVNVRVISATHKDLREEVNEHRFRQDLFFRLVVMAIDLPPLRERSGDVALLAQHFLDLHCVRYGKDIPGFSPEAMNALERFDWPGNVREIENEIERAVVLADDNEPIPVDLLSAHIRAVPGPPAPGVQVLDNGVFVPKGMTYDDAVITLERLLVMDALKACRGVSARAANMLGMERSRFFKLAKRLGALAEYGAAEG